MILCSLTMVKNYLGITGTEKDDLINILIKKASALINGYVGYSLERKNYIDELHNVNFNQLIQLDNQPIQKINSVKINGVEITDYKLIPKYAQIGMLYRGNGWKGGVYTRGLEDDIVSGEYSITVDYEAGYYLPGDENYVEGNADSLPFDIVSACLETVTQMYIARSNNAEGIKSYSEGGISTTYTNGDSALMGENGLSKMVVEMLFDYKKWGVA